MTEYQWTEAEEGDQRIATLQELADGQTYVFLVVGKTEDGGLRIGVECGGDIRDGRDLLTVLEFAASNIQGGLS